jgi:hypothetical protein
VASYGLPAISQEVLSVFFCSFLAWNFPFHVYAAADKQQYDQPRGLAVRVSDSWSWGPGFFFLEGEDPLGDRGLGSLVEFRFKAPPGTSYSYITIHLIGAT